MLFNFKNGNTKAESSWQQIIHRDSPKEVLWNTSQWFFKMIMENPFTVFRINPISPGSNESIAAELPDDRMDYDIEINAEIFASGSLAFFLKMESNMEWSKYFAPSLVDPVCQGSILSFGKTFGKINSSTFDNSIPRSTEWILTIKWSSAGGKRVDLRSWIDRKI